MDRSFVCERCGTTTEDYSVVVLQKRTHSEEKFTLADEYDCIIQAFCKPCLPTLTEPYVLLITIPIITGTKKVPDEFLPKGES